MQHESEVSEVSVSGDTEEDTVRRRTTQLPNLQPQTYFYVGKTLRFFFPIQTFGNYFLLCKLLAVLFTDREHWRPNTYSKLKMQTNLLFFAHSSSEINCTYENWILIRERINFSILKGKETLYASLENKKKRECNAPISL